jgi:hypothetical protein
MKSPSAQGRTIGVTILVALTAGCQNPYDKFYTSTIPPELNNRGLLPHTGETQFSSVSATEMKSSIETLVRRGYVVVGYAKFESKAGDYTSSLRAKAQEVQADIVLMSSAFARTRSGVTRVLDYDPLQGSTTYSSGQVHSSNYGLGGYIQPSGNFSSKNMPQSPMSSTASPGTFSADYVPYNVQLNGYSACFLRKFHYVIGARWSPLSDEQRRALQRNTGLVVNIVIEGTPAYAAHILPGDILLTIDGEGVVSGEMFIERALEKAGQVVKLGVLRDGVNKDIELRVDSPTPGLR